MNLLSTICKKRILIYGCLSVVAIIIVTIILQRPTDHIATVIAEDKHTVPLDQIVSGGPPPDGIPSID